jgi:hypothetical protein
LFGRAAKDEAPREPERLSDFSTIETRPSLMFRFKAPFEAELEQPQELLSNTRSTEERSAQDSNVYGAHGIVSSYNNAGSAIPV